MDLIEQEKLDREFVCEEDDMRNTNNHFRIKSTTNNNINGKYYSPPAMLKKS
jgi:hypothetical protein